MKRFLSFCILFLMTGYSLSANAASLVTVKSGGGLCPDGPCHSVIQIETDGTCHGCSHSVINPAAIAELKAAVDNADYKALRKRKFTGGCPTVSDGQESLYIFHTAKRDESFDSCKSAIDPQSEPFRTLLKVLNHP